jgi:hypothetical protein
MEVAAAQPADARANTSSPKTNIDRRPKRSPKAAPAISREAKLKL